MGSDFEGALGRAPRVLGAAARLFIALKGCGAARFHQAHASKHLGVLLMRGRCALQVLEKAFGSESSKNRSGSKK